MKSDVNMDSITIKNGVVFGLVMRRKHLAKRCLELILGKKISDITYIESEKTQEVSATTHGIRMDVYCENEEAIYNIEMQAYQMNDLPKRSRYYQDMMDMLLLEKGKDYDELRTNIVIFICTNDPFDQGRHIYRFENRCMEDTTLSLRDDSLKVFLNTKGKMNDIPRPLKIFLDYIEKGTVTDEYTKELNDAVEEVCGTEKWRESIMTFEMMQRDMEKMKEYEAKKAREKGLEEGRAEGRAEGREEGRAEGVSEEKKKTVLRMHEAGMPLDSIMIATELSEEEIRPFLNECTATVK